MSGNTVSLSWGAPASGGVPTSYALQVVGGPSYPMGVATSFTSPAPNGVYALRVVAANASGTGPASNTVQVTVPATVAPPGPPANLTAAVAGSTVSFGWAPPTSGGTVAGYTLQAGTTAGFVTPFASLPLPASATTLSVPGVPASTYYVRLVAQNAGGPGVASNEVTFTVAGPAPPSAPILNAPSVVGRTVTLSWSAGSGGGSPTSYVLSVTGALATTVPLTGTSISVPGVPSGTYQLRLTAVNSVGPSQPSAQVTLIVP